MATHGLSQIPEYQVWRAMIQRCEKPTSAMYPHYGGRGIAVCERWRDSVVNFVSDMGRRPTDKHSLDRINNDGPYSPENCRWATVEEQIANTSVARLLTFNGETMTISGWSRRTGLGRFTIAQRLDRGWTVERALSAPPKMGRSSKLTAEQIAEAKGLYAAGDGLMAIARRFNLHHSSMARHLVPRRGDTL